MRANGIAKDKNLGFLNKPLADRYEKLAKTLDHLNEPALAAEAREQAKKLGPPPKGPFICTSPHWRCSSLRR